jgi:uncharacterized protein YcbK (DUF882 family)
MLGEAIDIRIPSVPASELRDVALALQRGGVGYYPKSGFVQVDVGGLRRRRISSSSWGIGAGAVGVTFG